MGTLEPMDAKNVIELLRLQPHPEGGYFRETWRHAPGQGRGAGTAIYYLLRAGEKSRWHKHDAAEIWHYYAGAPVELSSFREGGTVRTSVLGADLSAGQRPQLIIEAAHWQEARSLGAWSLMGCTVSPAFEFEHFEMAPPNWVPKD